MVIRPSGGFLAQIAHQPTVDDAVDAVPLP